MTVLKRSIATLYCILNISNYLYETEFHFTTHFQFPFFFSKLLRWAGHQFCNARNVNNFNRNFLALAISSTDITNQICPPVS